MTPARWQKAKDLFLRLRGAELDQRTALLDQNCRDDLELRAEVESLLGYGDQAGNFLEKPAVCVEDDAPPAESALPVVGRRIGAYTILRELAAGGMGIVYEARQEHPKRVVALKVMKAGLSSASARRRFEEESQTLARLQHPAIAHVYEAGTQDEGGLVVPYFAMEFVPDARTITGYASSNRLDLRQRLELFLGVCDAVHHGHQKGIIHRDLKPANILVAGTGQPKVIDFGVARMIDPAAPAPVSQTATGRFVGTLQYMSPEQLDSGTYELDVRSDVYALGVVLFELLCGQLPYDVTRSGIYEAARIIKERAPLRPSTLNRVLRGDLDTIVLRCLEKERSRRYQSVADLANDIRHHLRHEPIEARRDSSFYVLRRNLYRHRWAAGIALAVLGAVVVTAWALSSRSQAEAARMRSALSLARTWTRDTAPVAASESLWREFFKLDSNRTRFALWEFYLKYPRVYANAKFGRQVDVEYSPSGKWLATVTADGRIVVYNARTGAAVHVVSGLKVPAKLVKYAPQSSYALYVGDAQERVCTHRFDDETGQVGDVPLYLAGASSGQTQIGLTTCLAVSACGTWLAAGSTATPSSDAEPGGRVRVWRLPETAPVHDVTIPCRGVRSIAFSPNAAQMAIGFQSINNCPPGGGVEIWDTESREILRKTTLDAIPRRSVLFSADGQHIFSGANYLLNWQLSSSKEPSQEKMCESIRKWGIRSLVAGEHATAQYLAFGSGDGLTRFYDTDRDTLLPIFGYHEHEPADHIDVCFSPDGRSVASVGPDGLSVWRFPAADELVLATQGETGRLMGMSEKAGELLVGRVVDQTATTRDGTSKNQIQVWSNEVLVARITVSQDKVDAAITRDSHRLAVYDAGDGPRGSIRVFASPDWTKVQASLDLSALTDSQPNSRVNVLHWLDAQGQMLLIGHEGGAMRIWDTHALSSDGTPSLHVFPSFDTTCTRFCLDSRGEWLAACSQGDGSEDRLGRVRVWRITGPVSVKDGVLSGVEQKLEFAAHSYVWFIAFVRDSHGRRLIATAGQPRSVYLWDAQTGQLAGKLDGHGNSIRNCAAVGGNLLLTQSDDLTVRIWDVDEREELCVLYRGEPSLLSTAVCGRWIAICDGARVTRLNVDEVDEVIKRNRGYEAERLRRLRERNE